MVWVGVGAAEINMLLTKPRVKERLDSPGFTSVGGTRAEFAAFIKSEVSKWGKAVKDSGTNVD